MPRPSKPLISRRKAAEAALEIVDAVGLEELSVAKVARRLGVQPPSLYYHFRDKEEMLSEVARLLLVKIPRVHPGDRSLEEWIVALCVSTRRTLLEHPNAALLLLQFFPRYLLLGAYDGLVQTYDYPAEYRLAVLEGTEKLTFGSALFAAAAVARGREPTPAVEADGLPHLAGALASNPLDEEALFEETLRTYLAGARLRIERHDIGQPIVRTEAAAV